MTSSFIVRGDHLPILTALAAGQSTGLDAPRAMVWGVDLSAAPTRHAAQKRLRQEIKDIAAITATHPSVVHLFIVYSHGGALLTGACLGSAAQAANRLHTEFERARGRFVEVVFIDVTGWEDSEALRDRIVQTVATPAGVAGDVALGWHDITDATIHRAAMSRFC